MFLHSFAAGLDAKHRAPLHERGPMHPAVRECARSLEESPARAWTLDDLASRVHLDRCYLTRIFKNQMGVAPLSYLSRLRAERAAALLVRTDASIAAIGQGVGWNDPSYFTQRFKAHFGMTPKDYRAAFVRTPSAAQPALSQVDDEDAWS